VGEVYRRFRGAYCPHHQGDDSSNMEEVGTSETSVNFYQITRATTQKTVNFIFAAVRTSNLTWHVNFQRSMLWS
jgi:hypothetical protein